MCMHIFTCQDYNPHAPEFTQVYPKCAPVCVISKRGKSGRTLFVLDIAKTRDKAARKRGGTKGTHRAV